MLTYQEFMKAAEKDNFPDNLETQGIISGINAAFTSLGKFDLFSKSHELLCLQKAVLLTVYTLGEAIYQRYHAANHKTEHMLNNERSPLMG
ncbi:hypothetical protein LSH36_40g15032 [Paralvinella palmiformis]|uniref:Uncharacterized protein n=1 Tax=Paralvinella palmiformis TaxID=53620 RepID=A0AAD9K7K6_9ANNE|nr:hypothetical protein LSH36_40g15032 [Paralvinella palmiformis]